MTKTFKENENAEWRMFGEGAAGILDDTFYIFDLLVKP